MKFSVLRGLFFCILCIISISPLSGKDIDTMLIRQMLDESEKLFYEGQFSEAKNIAEKTVRLVSENCGIACSLLAKAKNRIANCYTVEDKHNEALSSCQSALEIYTKEGLSSDVTLVGIYNTLGINFREKGQMEEAMQAHEKAIALLTELGRDTSKEAVKCYRSLSTTLYKDGQAQLALNYAKHALNIEFALKEFEGKSLGLSYIYIGELFGQQLIQDSAKWYYEKGLDFLISYDTLKVDLPTAYEKYGTWLFYNGTYQKALDIFKSSLALREDQKNNILELGKGYIRLATCHFYLQHYNRSIENYLVGIRFQEQEFPEDHPELAISYFGLAVSYYYKGAFEKALTYYQKSYEVELKKENLDASIHLKYYNAFASTYYYNRNYHRAAAYYQQILNLYQTLNDQLSVARFSISLGKALARSGQTEQAVEYFNSALNYFEQTPEYYHESIAVLKELGDIFFQKGQIPLALNKLEAAEQRILEIYGEKIFYLQEVYFSKGAVFLWNKDYEKAFDNYSKALKLYGEYMGSDNPNLINYYHQVAGTLFDQEKYEEALSVINEAFAIIDLPQNQNSLEEKDFQRPIHDALTLKGAIYYKLHDKNQLTQYLDSSRYYNFKALENTFSILRSLKGTVDKRNLLEYDLVNFSNLVWTNYKLAKGTGDQRYLADAFEVSEQYKSIFLRQAIVENTSNNFTGLPESLIVKEKELKTDLDYYRKSLFTKLKQKENQTDSSIAYFNQKIFALLTTQDSLTEHIKLNYPDYYNLKFNNQVASTKDIQSNLKKDQATLAFFQEPEYLFTFLILKDTLIVQEIELDFPLEEWVTEMREGIYNYWLLNERSSATYLEYHENYTQAAYHLYQKLIEPIAEHLPYKITIIPAGILSYLPFDALLTAEKYQVGYPNSYPYLLKKHQLTYAYSASLLLEMQHKKTKASKPILAFAPDFSGEPLASREIMDQRRSLGKLKYNIPEAETISDLLQGDLLVGAEATLEQFKNIAGQYRILHLATHGKVDEQNGDYSFLAFSSDIDTVEATLLYLRDLYGLQLNADLVVLSACETGLGKFQSGEGVLSLARGFAYAGAKSMINSLWSVNDQSTQFLMNQFYIHLKKGKSKDEALREAKLDYLASGQNPDPFYWAGFVPVGDMSPLYKKTFINYLPYLVGFVLLAGILLFGRRVWAN